MSPTGYLNCFGKPSGIGTKEGVQDEIIGVTFKKLISKLMVQKMWLNKPENMALNSDMRAFLSFVQTYHGDTFRRIIMSGLMLPIVTVDQRVEGKHYAR